MTMGVNRRFDLSIDTGLLLTMLIAGVYFGAQIRSDLDHAVTAVNKVATAFEEMTRKVNAMEYRIRDIERNLERQVP